MRNTTAAVLALIGLVLVPRMASADATGKTSASIAQTGVALGSNPTASVHLEKGKKKRLLLINATVSTSGSSGVLTASGTVNGLALNPATIAQKCAGACSTTATWSVDIDSAEAANPGGFVGVPLIIDITGGASTITTGDIAVTATLVKK